MSTLSFSESKMLFVWDENDCFRIEKSEAVLGLGDGIKICEFVANWSGTIIFVEAKSSFPHPDSTGDFQGLIQNIYEKFLNSLLIYAGILVGRPYANAATLPSRLSLESIRGARFRFHLVIRGHRDEWLVGVDEALNQKFVAIVPAFAIDSIKAINEKTALAHGLIRSVCS
jgi:hypothetical protein